MLSPKECATLMLINSVPDQIELGRVELHALLERRYVTIEPLASGHRLPRITAHGQAFLHAVAGIR